MNEFEDAGSYEEYLASVREQDALTLREQMKILRIWVHHFRPDCCGAPSDAPCHTEATEDDD